MKRFFSFLITIVLISSINDIAIAGTIVCTGKVEKIGMHGNDKLMFKLTSMNQPVFFCKTSGKWEVPGTTYTTEPETCQALLSMLMMAKATGAEMGNVWMDGNDTPASCDAFQPWKQINIRYFNF